MSQSIEIKVSEDGPKHTLEGVPDVAWEKFCAAAKIQFPKEGEDAWAKFLSEVIMSGAGGADTVTYFMTGVPRENASAVADMFGQVGWSWDRFHVYLLKSAVKKGQLHLLSFSAPGDTENFGTFIATGLKPATFTKLQETIGVSFERIMGTLLLAAADGTLTFRPEQQFIEPTNPPD